MSHWAIVAAAGIGRRMQMDIPKQYLPLAGRRVIEHSLDRLADHAAIAGLVVVVQAGDSQWAALNYQHTKPLYQVDGGVNRADSVLAGCQALTGIAEDNDWVLVHDAARPCLTHSEVDKLINDVGDDPVGGLLALPSHSTLKNAVDGRANETLDRNRIWQAQTPQMFRLGLLRDALEAALSKGKAITDESMALELAGHRPRLVSGQTTNIKITTPEDLPLAEFILQQQANG